MKLRMVHAVKYIIWLTEANVREKQHQSDNLYYLNERNIYSLGKKNFLATNITLHIIHGTTHTHSLTYYLFLSDKFF